jgi:hypothetical protein
MTSGSFSLEGSAFRAGILYRVAEFLCFLRDEPLSVPQTDNHFSEWHGIAMQSVLGVADSAGWIVRNQVGEYCLSATGEDLANQPTPIAALREMVMQLALELKPSWMRLAVRGRTAVLEYAPPEVVQCLTESGLGRSTDLATVCWWDRFSGAGRSGTDQKRLEEGRRGERLSYEYERLRTGFEPRWVALENSGAGYDLLSVVSRTDSTPSIIEVKTTTETWSSGKFWLTRNEWTILSQSEHARLHLWSVDGGFVWFCVVEAQGLSTHIPFDQGAGTWEVLSARFADITGEPAVATRVQDLLASEGE